MICSKCGSQIDDNAVVCPKCGNPVGSKGGTQVPFGGGAAEAPKVPFFQRKSESINFIAVILAALGIVCTFFAKVTASYEVFSVKETHSESIFSLYGYLIAALFLACVILLIVRQSNSAIILAAINAVFCVFKMIQQKANDSGDIKALVEEAESLGLDAKVSTGFNIFYWLMLILSILVVVAIVVLPKVMGNKTTK